MTRSVLLAAAACALALVGCTSEAVQPSAETPVSSATSEAPKPSATVSTNVADSREPVTVDTKLRVTAEGGELERVVVRGGGEKLVGQMVDNGQAWRATDRLEPGLRYRVTAVAVDAEGLRTRHRSSFRTERLPLERQTYPSIAPLDGETVGVGMPVIVQFDVPVTNRASIERHLDVESSSGQKGAWHWVDENEVHWRPKTYWEPGTEVTVHADINSVPAGNGVYGQLSRTISFTVGDAVVSKIDVGKHRMRVFVNGDLARTMPISAGKPGFITRSGTKVIMGKHRRKVMDATSIGISKSSPEYYRLDVEYAMRLTHSGEFLHAAPWSAGSQGLANVSHGCVGMSTRNASWLFGLSRRGDVVEVTGSDRHMTLYNGWGDWNASFAEYAEGSALD